MNHNIVSSVYYDHMYHTSTGILHGEKVSLIQLTYNDAMSL